MMGMMAAHMQHMGFFPQQMPVLSNAQAQLAIMGPDAASGHGTDPSPSNGNAEA
jgi:hypothetical protein